MTTVITHIYYSIAQGEATTEDWHRYADYADRRLHQAYPEADITVLLVNQDPDAGLVFASATPLVIETREAHPDDAPGHLSRAREEAETFVGRLWDEFCRE